MTREELKEHCLRQVEGCEMWAKCKGEEPHGKVYEEHKLILELLEQEPKIGHWIEVAKYSDGKHEIECSKCGSHIFDRGHANSYIVKEKYKYCPRCGAKMVKPHESEEV